jgi:hypothetical protein
MGTHINVPAVVSVMHAKTTTTPVDPFDAQNNIGRTLNSNSVGWYDRTITVYPLW